MKNIFKLIMTAMFILAIPASAFADNHTENETQAVDVTLTSNITETENETEIESEVEIETETNEDNKEELNESVLDDEDKKYISNGIGAQVRLKQLERRIELQIATGEIILEKLNDNNNTETARLEEILEEFQALIIEIENTNFNQSNEVLAEEFIQTKAIAINLSKEFRNIAKDSLTATEKAEIQMLMKEKKKEVYENHREKIKELKQKHNAQIAKRYLDKFGVDTIEIRAKIESGELNVEEIKNRIKKKYSNLDEEQKEKIKQKIQEEKQKAKIAQKDLIQKQREIVREKEAKWKEDLREIRLENQEKLKEEIQERRSEIREKVQNNREELREKWKNLSPEERRKLVDEITKTGIDIDNVDDVLKNDSE